MALTLHCSIARVLSHSPQNKLRGGSLSTSQAPHSLFQLLAHSRGRCRPGQLLPWGRRRVALVLAVAPAAASAPALAAAAASTTSQTSAPGRAEGPAATAMTAAMMPGAPGTPLVAVT